MPLRIGDTALWLFIYMKISEYKKVVGRSKFGNKKTLYNGRLYSSKKEASRAYELDLLQAGGIIRKWEAQIPFAFQLNGVKICKYICDFRVFYKDGRVEIEDVKGFRTDIYRLKKKLMKAFYEIEIVEI